MKIPAIKTFNLEELGWLFAKFVGVSYIALIAISLLEHFARLKVCKDGANVLKVDIVFDPSNCFHVYAYL